MRCIISVLASLHSTGTFKSSPIPSALVDANELSLKNRWLKLGLQHFLRLRALPDSVACNIVYVCSSHHLFIGTTARPPLGIRMQSVVDSFSPSDIDIISCFHPLEPSCRAPDIVCNNLLVVRKSSYTSPQLRRRFEDHNRADHRNSYQIYTDGIYSSSGSCFGIYSSWTSMSIKLSPLVLHSQRICTASLKHWTTYLSKKPSYPHSTIFTYSRGCIYLLRSVVNNHPVYIKYSPNLFTWVKLATRSLFDGSPDMLAWSGNEKSDRLANEAAESDTPPVHKFIPYNDIRTHTHPHIPTCIYSRGQAECYSEPTTNKLRAFRNTVKAWSLSCLRHRKHEIILTWLRIGHSLHSLGYLMRGSRVPDYCQHYLVPLTIKHILEECPEYSDQRPTLGQRSPCGKYWVSLLQKRSIIIQYPLLLSLRV